MLLGEIAKRELPNTEEEKAMLVKDMVNELLERCFPTFNTTTFIVHEIDGNLTVGMKWESS